MADSIIRERISQYLSYKNISDYRFEKDLDLSKGYWNKAKNPSSEILNKISGIYTDLSAEWLLRGEGEMLKRSNISQDEDSSQKNTDQDAEYWKHVALSNMEIMTLHVDDLNARIKELEAEILNLKSNGSMELSSSANPA
jgi:uncharacterized small protein (DUF1192 family)